MVGKEDGGLVLDISGKVIGVGQLCMLFFSGSLIRGSYLCIASVFLDIPVPTPVKQLQEVLVLFHIGV
jgi:hypothetical protein